MADTELAPLKIGDTVWFFDVNRRIYKDHELIYREHFVPLKIVGENKMSWLLEHGHKCKKGTLTISAQGFGEYHFYRQDDMEKRIYLHNHRHKIAAAISDLKNVDLLREIAKSIGYDDGQGVN